MCGDGFRGGCLAHDHWRGGQLRQRVRHALQGLDLNDWWRAFDVVRERKGSARAVAGGSIGCGVHQLVGGARE
eukprot:1180660-Alexandrium_andersonii.AAC.1